MPAEIDLQTRFEAEDLYVHHRLTYAQVAARLNVSQSTVERWGADNGWKELRAQALESRKSLRENLQKLREALMRQAIESQDPQKAFAALRVVEAERKHAVAEAREEIAPIDAPRIFMEHMEFIVNFLRTADPEGLKILARNFDPMIAAFKENHAATA